MLVKGATEDIINVTDMTTTVQARHISLLIRDDNDTKKRLQFYNYITYVIAVNSLRLSDAYMPQ